MPSRFYSAVQFEFNEKGTLAQGRAEELKLSASRIPVLLKRNPRARRYLLRLDASGRARITIPRWGSAAEARRFAERNTQWLEQQLHQLASQPRPAGEWWAGGVILFRGELVKIAEDAKEGIIRLGSEVIPAIEGKNTRATIEKHLRGLALSELPAKVLHFAGRHELQISRVCIRDQRTRWGSCSVKRIISLNWRLIQAPAAVTDYIILHELMHLREMNHSARFWRQVERVCPDYLQAEKWLKRHAFLLNDR